MTANFESHVRKRNCLIRILHCDGIDEISRVDVKNLDLDSIADENDVAEKRTGVDLARVDIDEVEEEFNGVSEGVDADDSVLVVRADDVVLVLDELICEGRFSVREVFSPGWSDRFCALAGVVELEHFDAFQSAVDEVVVSDQSA
jgi:hypothetical protein